MIAFRDDEDRQRLVAVALLGLTAALADAEISVDPKTGRSIAVWPAGTVSTVLVLLGHLQNLTGSPATLARMRPSEIRVVRRRLTVGPL